MSPGVTDRHSRTFFDFWGLYVGHLSWLFLGVLDRGVLIEPGYLFLQSLQKYLASGLSPLVRPEYCP